MCDSVEAQALGVPENNHFAIKRRQCFDGFGEPRGPFVLDGPLARGRVWRGQVSHEVPCRAIDRGQASLAAEIAPSSAAIITNAIHHNSGKYLAQPAPELTVRATSEVANLSVHLERDVLEQVLDVQFDAQPAADLAVKLLHQRITMSIQQPHQGRAVAGLGQDEQQLRVGVPVECDAGLHDLSSNRRSQIAPRRNGFFFKYRPNS